MLVLERKTKEIGKVTKLFKPTEDKIETSMFILIQLYKTQYNELGIDLNVLETKIDQFKSK